MLFSGKKYRRIACENIEELFNKTDAKDCMIQLLKSNAPVFSFQRLDEETLSFTLEIDNKSFIHTFRLGEEHEMEKLDGSTVRMTYILENDNVLMQVIKRPDGQEVHFRREFRENEAEMIITIPGTDVRAKVIYEMVP